MATIQNLVLVRLLPYVEGARTNVVNIVSVLKEKPSYSPVAGHIAGKAMVYLK